MKVTLAIVAVLGLALSVNCSVIAGHGLSYTAVSGPHHAIVAPLVHHASVAHHGYHDDGHWHGDWHGDHYGHDDGQWHGDWHGHHYPAAIDLHHGHHYPAAIDVHHAVPYVHHGHHEGQYVAKTRGAVHTAPLAGHIQSAAAINVAPAPGTY
ncbi:hypothetical protein ACFFRR_004864 [Megaselia abdita]